MILRGKSGRLTVSRSGVEGFTTPVVLLTAPVMLFTAPVMLLATPVNHRGWLSGWSSEGSNSEREEEDGSEFETEHDGGDNEYLVFDCIGEGILTRDRWEGVSSFIPWTADYVLLPKNCIDPVSQRFSLGPVLRVPRSHMLVPEP